MRLGYYGAVSSDAGSGYELDVIAAAVVGAVAQRGAWIGLRAMLGAVVIQRSKTASCTEHRLELQAIIVGLAIILLWWWIRPNIA